MSDEKILNKIKKCLALSKSSEPHEAAAALRQAQKLMEAHNLSVVDIHASEIGEVNVQSRVSVSKPKDWEVVLIRVVASAFGCEVLWLPSSSYNQNKFGNFILIGLKSQLEIAQYTCEVLSRKLLAGRTKFVKSLPEYLNKHEKSIQAEGFCKGWVYTIAKTVHAFANTQETQKAIENRASEIGKGEYKPKEKKYGNYGVNAGIAAAEGESIYHGVRTESNKKLANF